VFPASVIAESRASSPDKHINFFDRPVCIYGILTIPEPPYYHSYQRRSLSGLDGEI
jgi:hypothetical protein